MNILLKIKKKLGILKFIDKCKNLLKLTPDSTINKYKNIEYLWFLDSGSEEERIKLYLIGLKIFKKNQEILNNKNNDLDEKNNDFDKKNKEFDENNHVFDDFKGFHLDRKKRIYEFKRIILYVLIFFSLLWIVCWIFLLWKIQYILIFPVIYFSIKFLFFNNSIKNLRKNESFFNYIDYGNKRNNYDAFLKISEEDQESLSYFTYMFRSKKDFEKLSVKHNLNGSEKLIALNMFLGELGAISKFRMLKSKLSSGERITYTNFDEFVSRLMNMDTTNVRKFFSKRVWELENKHELNEVDERQLKNVRDFFLDFQLHVVADKVSNIINNKNFKKKII
jgi:hypothetical protein